MLFKEATFRLRVLRDPVEVNILNENQLVFSATTLITDILVAEQELRVFKNAIGVTFRIILTGHKLNSKVVLLLNSRESSPVGGSI